MEFKGLNDRDKCLKCWCELSAMIDSSPDVIPCTSISRITGISKGAVRKIAKELERDGYIVKGHEGGFDKNSCHVYCIHGYCITDKGTELEWYKNRYKQEVEYWDNVIRGLGVM